jgi:hypothetical protein
MVCDSSGYQATTGPLRRTPKRPHSHVRILIRQADYRSNFPNYWWLNGARFILQGRHGATGMMAISRPCSHPSNTLEFSPAMNLSSLLLPFNSFPGSFNTNTRQSHTQYQRNKNEHARPRSFRFAIPEDSQTTESRDQRNYSNAQ